MGSDCIVSVPDHCLSFYFEKHSLNFIADTMNWFLNSMLD